MVDVIEFLIAKSDFVHQTQIVENFTRWIILFLIAGYFPVLKP